MFSFWGEEPRFPHGLRRRELLQLGGLGLGGLTLPGLLRARAASGQRPAARSVIMICLAGGPSHIDTYDMKPDAPEDIRGPYKPIRSKVPGLDLCELMPKQAACADQFSVVRSLRFVEPMQHELEEVYSGFPVAAQRPAFGSVISRFKADPPRGLPRYVSLDQYVSNRSYEGPKYIGAAHEAFVFGQDGMKNLHLHRGVSIDRLNDRRGLLDAFDHLRRNVDRQTARADIDPFTAEALDLITSPRARDAFDLSREPLAVQERYGPKEQKYIYGNKPVAGDRWPGQQFLLARRLVEAGVSVVTLRAGRWDYHGTASGTGNIFTGQTSLLPLLDHSVAALLTDLHERGLDKEVLVLVWGEFGRTPRVNRTEGRDHWPDASFALLSGAGIRPGQVIGATDRHAGQVTQRPLGPQNVLATLYHALGIDPRQTVPDFTGRPQHLLDDPEPIAELI